jgi:hypothetical protein
LKGKFFLLSPASSSEDVLKVVSRLALKIVVGAREQGTLNREHRREFWAILLFFTYL